MAWAKIHHVTYSTAVMMFFLQYALFLVADMGFMKSMAHMLKGFFTVTGIKDLVGVGVETKSSQSLHSYTNSSKSALIKAHQQRTLMNLYTKQARCAQDRKVAEYGVHLLQYS